MTFGNTVVGPNKWELYEYRKDGAVFTITVEETVDRIYAYIRNALDWAMSNPALIAFIQDLDNDQLMATSEIVAMPPSNDPSNVYKWYPFLLPGPVTLPPGRYYLGLWCIGYGGIDWRYTSSGLASNFFTWQNYKTESLLSQTLQGGQPSDPALCVDTLPPKVPCACPITEGVCDGPCATAIKAVKPDAGVSGQVYCYNGNCIGTGYRSYNIFATLGEAQHGPVAAFNWTPQIPIINKPVTFDASPSQDGWTGTDPSPIVNWLWDFGDGSTGSELTVEHTYAVAGDYSVVLAVTDQQGLANSVTQVVTVSGAGKVSITADFEAEEDFQIGIENAEKFYHYSQPTTVQLGKPKVITYGGYTWVWEQAKCGCDVYANIMDFSPENYNDPNSFNVPPPPIANSGSRCAKMHLKNPNYDSESYRLELFKYYDPYIREIELEAWYYFPPDFQVDDWVVFHRANRELLFRAKQLVPSWNDTVWNSTGGCGIGATNLVPGTDPPRYRIGMSINHCDVPGCLLGGQHRYDTMSAPEDSMMLGEWFYLKSYIYRHEKYGRIKVWLNNKLIFDLVGTDAHPICTMRVPPEIYSQATPWNPGGGLPYGAPMHGLANYTFNAGNPINPKAIFVKNLTLSYYVGEPTTYALTILSSTNGATNPAAGTYDYAAHSTQHILAVADEGFMLDHWLLDGVNVGNQNPYPTLMDNNHTLQAIFTVIPPGQWAITISCVPAEGGTTIPAGTIGIQEGQDLTVQANPNNGYRFDHWELDGASIGSSNPVTIPAQAPETNHSLFALFITLPPTPQIPAWMLVVPTIGAFLYFLWKK